MSVTFIPAFKATKNVLLLMIASQNEHRKKSENKTILHQSRGLITLTYVARNIR